MHPTNKTSIKSAKHLQKRIGLLKGIAAILVAMVFALIGFLVLNYSGEGMTLMSWALSAVVVLLLIANVAIHQYIRELETIKESITD